MTTTTPLRRAVTQLGRRRTWTELAYALIGLPLGVLGFMFTLATLALGVGLLVTVVGVVVLAVSNVGVRFLAGGARLQANILLGAQVAEPSPVRTREQGRGYLRAHLTDPVAWRGRLYLLAKLPLSIVAFVVAVMFYLYGLGAATYVAWRPFVDNCTGSRCHHAIGITDSWRGRSSRRVPTPPRPPDCSTRPTPPRSRRSSRCVTSPGVSTRRCSTPA